MVASARTGICGEGRVVYGHVAFKIEDDGEEHQDAEGISQEDEGEAGNHGHGQ